ncbi:AAA family ATPase [Parahaliea sp. F7430]|uniref:DNA 3'-5' helicase II n=1 Tax=Sediminihaliea albiluteola TaxID=2758564 RepID=A0A7W2YKI8_9GAMM|nr:UvrD-helicase domain-containing protein [Sediminihaliea albiluteola]MBA6413403.1 AAA family ATPase [Sediminihaliea albiluteola]
MAKIFPSLEVIKKSKQKPTEGELFLLNELSQNFDAEVEIYFQPFFNGERPDIIIIHQIMGVIIIEVKDWDLSFYNLDENNKWHVNNNGSVIRSPFAQVFGYKKNMFDLHINGLLEKNLNNKNFYKAISCYVYFHSENKESIQRFFSPRIDEFKGMLKEHNNAYAENPIDYDKYERKREWLNSKIKRFERDLYRHSVTKDQLIKIKFPLSKKSEIYPISIHDAFLRYLQPPYHYLNEGKEIEYTKVQERLVTSEQGKREKIKGVAGSGKTTVLAKRAVNAHSRHRGNVLILTFNLTLRMYIKDKLNEVRSDFSWGAFGIINYHRFMSAALSQYGIDVSVPEEIKNDKKKVSAYLDSKYYSNESVFESCEIEEKFDTILIDEIQDYKPEWIKIIRKYFLSDQGEMVLFGDEKQNIYEREIDEENSTKVIQGFGRWNKLSKSFRYKEDSHILDVAKRFQEAFFSDRYELDFSEAMQPALTGVGVNECVLIDGSDIDSIVSYVFSVAKRESIHPNDMVIISSSISQMREIDFLIRKNANFNEKTLTTFETKEAYCSSRIDRSETEKIRSNKKYGFNLNSGVLKISTIHSFKGYESPTVFLIVNELDSAELVYVGLTRAKFNLVVFLEKNSKYSDFFKGSLEVIELSDAIENDMERV